ncbi:uncharacterized protein [Pyrus communis]|uniref:uncharacterized protein n=1 Tax=Pyrus communis TaxID=23211 RepID=UPI0035C19E17
MNKAYDRVEWDFLEAVVRKMGLCDACVSFIQFSVLLNGQPGKKFKPLRGLWQGDPCHHTYFFIVCEVLSRLIKRATGLGFLDGIQLSVNGPKLTHLLFADDTFVFLKVTPDNCRNMSNLLKAYCRASGQQVSLQKSTVYFSANTPMAMAQELGVNLEMLVVKDPVMYLGVPTVKDDCLIYSFCSSGPATNAPTQLFFGG